MAHMGKLFKKQFGNTRIKSGCNFCKSTKKPPSIEVSFFENGDEMDFADKLAFTKYRKNDYDSLNQTQKREVRMIIKNKRGKGVFED